jgi:hypothetical protein
MCACPAAQQLQQPVGSCIAYIAVVLQALPHLLLVRLLLLLCGVLL